MTRADRLRQNILIASLDPIRVKLADFGASKQTKNTALRTRCGTQGYFAPELLGLLPRRFRAGSSQEFSYAIDMWSLGCLLHEMLTSKTPFLRLDDGDIDMTGVDFEPETDTEFLYDYCVGDASFPIEILQASGVSRNGITFIKQLLMPNPAMRPTAVRTLEHSWLAESDLEDADTGLQLDLRAPTLTLSVTDDECFHNFTRLLNGEKSGLRIFFDGNALRDSARAAKKMVEGLFRLGCKKGVAMQLSVLVLYDLVILIGLPLTPSLIRSSWCPGRVRPNQGSRWPNQNFRP